MGPQPLQASHEKGAQPEADESCAPLLPYLSAPRLQERPQEPICARVTRLEGQGHLGGVTVPQSCLNSLGCCWQGVGSG